MSYEYYEHDEEEEELEQDIFDDTSMFRVKPLETFFGQKNLAQPLLDGQL